MHRYVLRRTKVGIYFQKYSNVKCKQNFGFGVCEVYQAEMPFRSNIEEEMRNPIELQPHNSHWKFNQNKVNEICVLKGRTLCIEYWRQYQSTPPYPLVNIRIATTQHVLFLLNREKWRTFTENKEHTLCYSVSITTVRHVHYTVWSERVLFLFSLIHTRSQSRSKNKRFWSREFMFVHRTC